MTGSIILSCGHKAKDADEGEPVMYRGWGCDGAYVAHAVYCKKCARELRRSERYIASEREGRAYLRDANWI